jgi:hypothetical protein
LRLLHKLPVLYGSRFFDILLLDALYAHAPVLQLADRIGWDLVISLKQNQRELYQSAVRLFARRPADSSGTERHDGKQYQFQIWDSAGFPFSADHPQPVRVVRSEEKLTQNHYRRGKLQPETTEHEWLWIRTLDAKAFPATLVRRLGHDRWKLENNGWNDLTQNGAFKHGFLHACRHRLRTASAEGERTWAKVEEGEAGGRPQTASKRTSAPLSPTGDWRQSLILLLAFTLCSAFIHCHSKLFRRYSMSAIEVARQLRLSVSKRPPNIRAPDARAAPPSYLISESAPDLVQTGITPVASGLRCARATRSPPSAQQHLRPKIRHANLPTPAGATIHQ